MSEVTKSNGMRGILIPDPRISSDTWAGSLSTCSEAGVMPGPAVPDQTTKMAVGTYGEVLNTDVSGYRILASRGGMPGQGAWVWATLGLDGTVGIVKQWNAPNCALDIHHIGGDSTGGATGVPAAVKTQTGRVVVLWGQISAGLDVTVYVSYTDDGNDWTGADGSLPVISEDTASDVYYGYALDSVNCYALFYDEQREVLQAFVRILSSADPAALQFVLIESADDGVTWAVAERNILSQGWTPDEPCSAPTIAAINGALMLLQPNDDGVTYYCAQWTSLDHGRRFDLVKSDAHSYFNHRLITVGKRLLCVMISSANDVEVVFLNNAFESIHDASPDTIASITSAGFLAVALQHGQLVLFVAPSSMLDCDVYHSATGEADDWSDYGYGLFSWNSTSNHIDTSNFAAVPLNGGLYLLFKASDTGVDSAMRGLVYAMRCGGWATSLALPITEISPEGPSRLSFGNPISTASYWLVSSSTWYPWQTLSDYGWTLTSTGGTTTLYASTGGSPMMEIAVPSGSARYYEATTTGDPDKGMIVYIDANIVEGGSLTTNEGGLRVALSDGTTEYQVIMRMSEDGIALRDANSTTSDIVSTPVTGRYCYLLSLRQYAAGAGACKLYRAPVDGGPLLFVEQGGIELTPDTTSPAATSVIQVGALTATSRDYTLELYALHVVMASSDGAEHDITLGKVPNIGAPMPAIPSDVDSGFMVSFSGGYAEAGHTWTARNRYAYAKESVYPSVLPSPRDAYRSEDDTHNSIFVWEWNENSTPEGFGSSTWGLYLGNINFHSVEWEGYTSAGAWETIVSIDNSVEFTGLPYRAGHSSASAPYITVNTAGSGGASRYIAHNELAGGTLVIGSNSYRILRNTEGTWSTTTGKKPVLFIDPATWSSSEAATGTCSIWPPRLLALAHGKANTEYRRIRVRIPAQTTVDGYLQVGTMVLGPVVTFGRDYSYGRTWARQPGGTVTEAGGGARFSAVAAPPRYLSSIAWVDASSSSQLYGSAEPDYVALGGTGANYAAATRDGTALLLSGLLDDTNGPDLPMVLIHNIPGADTEEVITDPQRCVYGRQTGPIVSQMVRGTEFNNEVVQVNEITVEEEV